MKTKLKVLLTTFALVGAMSLALSALQAQNPPATPGAPAAGAAKGKGKERHPAIHRAIVELEAAKKYLEHADHDFGGHRKQALADCEKAVEQFKLALQYDKQ